MPRSGSRAMRRASSADRRARQGQTSRRPRRLLPVLGEDLGHEHRRRELHELRGLELEAADQDPAPRARDHGREAQHVEERHHGEDVEEHGAVGEAAVVEAGGHHERRACPPRRGRAASGRGRGAARVGGGVHHRHPDEGEGEGRPERGPSPRCRRSGGRFPPPRLVLRLGVGDAGGARRPPAGRGRSSGRGSAAPPAPRTRRRCCPCSTSTASAIVGLSAGAKARNQPWGSISSAFGDFSSRDFATTCAEPVLPQTSMLGAGARASRCPRPPPRACPPSRPRSSRAGSRAGRALRGRRPGARTRWGRTSRPPFAITAATRAICSGVALTCPWPIATETVSPAYQGVLKRRIFHSGLGMRPEPSWGRSMPVGAPRPMSFAHFARRPISSRMPDLVEVDVARVRDRAGAGP